MTKPAAYRSPEERSARAWDRLSKPADVELGDRARSQLAEMGVLPVEGGRILWPGDGTILAAWRHCEEALLEGSSIADFELYRRGKGLLGAGILPPSIRAVRLAQECAGDRLLTQRHGRQLLGSSCSQACIAAAGLPGKRRVADRTTNPADVEELFNLFPEQYRDRLRATLTRNVLPPIVPPTASHVGRVLALCGDPCRVLAAAALLAASSANLSSGMSNLYITTAERLDRIIEAAAQSDPTLVTEALDRIAGGTPTRAMAWSLYQLHGMVRQAEEYLRVALGDEASEVEALLPAGHLRGEQFRQRMWAIHYEAAKLNRAGKESRIVSMAPSLEALMIACDNRVAQAEGLFVKVTQAAAAQRESGQTGGIVDCIGAVVRSDGSLGAGQQIVRFELRTEADLIAAAHDQSPRDYKINGLRSRRLGRSDTGARMHLVYRETVPLEQGGEHVEPFFVDAIRLGLLDDGVGLTRAQEQARADMFAASGLPHAIQPVDGILHHPWSQRFLFTSLRRVMGSEAPVIVPLTNLLHGLSIARILVGMAIRSGARIGETRQLRTGCFLSDVRNGRKVYIAMLRPKGRDAEAAFVIDGSVLEQIRRVRKMACSRWFRGVLENGQPALPIVPFRDTGRVDIPDARYILVGPTGVLSKAHLSVLVRFLFVGIAEVLCHDLRYLFATKLGLDGVPTVEIAPEMHHAAGSKVTSRYDLSDEVLFASAAVDGSGSAPAVIRGVAA